LGKQDQIWEKIFCIPKNMHSRTPMRDTQLRHFVLVTLLPTGRSQVRRKFSSGSQSKTSWPPLVYWNISSLIDINSVKESREVANVFSG